MAIELAQAYVSVIPSADGIQSKIEDVFGKDIGGALQSKGTESGQSWAAAFSAAVLTVTEIAADIATAFAEGVADVAAYGDNIDKMSQKMGLSAEAYQEWDAIMQHSGTSIESLQTGMKTLANAVENGNDAFARLGISQEQISQMSNEDLFSATITALQNVENETERTYLAGQLLGRGATELGPLLNTSAEETEAMRQRVHELGGVMSDEAVKAAAAYQDSLQDMQTAMKGGARALLSEFLPSITSVMDGLTEIFSGNSGVGIGLVSQGLTQFVEKISQTIPRLLEMGVDILSSLSGAIIENLPLLIEAGAQALLMLADGLLQQLPALAESAVRIIVTLANGISGSMPELIPIAVDVILQIAQTLISNLPLILDAALQLIIGLTEGLIKSIPVIIAALPEIIAAIVDFVVGATPQLVDAGVQLLTSLVENLPLIITMVVSVIPQIIEGIVNALIGNIPMIVQAGVQLITSLTKNLPQIIMQIVTAAPEIIYGLVSALMQGVSQLADVGKNLVLGLWSGIQSLAGWLWEQVSTWVSSIWSGILDFFGIHSPSTEMAWVGEMLVEGLSNSIDENGDEAVKAAGNMAEGVLGALDGLAADLETSLQAEYSAAAAIPKQAFGPASTGFAGTSIGNLIVNVNTKEGQDANQIAEAVMEKIYYAVRKKESVFA